MHTPTLLQRLDNHDAIPKERFPPRYISKLYVELSPAPYHLVLTHEEPQCIEPAALLDWCCRIRQRSRFRRSSWERDRRSNVCIIWCLPGDCNESELGLSISPHIQFKSWVKHRFALSRGKISKRWSCIATWSVFRCINGRVFGLSWRKTDDNVLLFCIWSEKILRRGMPVGRITIERKWTLTVLHPQKSDADNSHDHAIYNSCNDFGSPDSRLGRRWWHGLD